jgi:hypothetical protein
MDNYAVLLEYGIDLNRYGAEQPGSTINVPPSPQTVIVAELLQE